MTALFLSSDNLPVCFKRLSALKVDIL